MPKDKTPNPPHDPVNHASQETPTEEDTDEEDEPFPWLDPILDNVERWPNLLIMDSLLDDGALLEEEPPPPESIVRALDGLERLATARKTSGDTDEYRKHFHDVPDWTYTHRESDETMTQQGQARRFKDGADAVLADASLSWNDGDAIFMVGYLSHKGTLLAYFGPQP